MASGHPPDAVTSLKRGSQTLCSGHLSMQHSSLRRSSPQRRLCPDAHPYGEGRENYSAFVTAGKEFKLPQHSAKPF